MIVCDIKKGREVFKYFSCCLFYMAHGLSRIHLQLHAVAIDGTII